MARKSLCLADIRATKRLRGAAEARPASVPSVQQSVECPICDARVPLCNINEHLDAGRCRPPSPARVSLRADVVIDLEAEENQDSLPIAESEHMPLPSASNLELVSAEPDGQQEEGLHVPYYVRNLEFVIHSVLEMSSSEALFDDADRQAAAVLCGLSLEARMLFTRLFQRKARWFRVAKLDYPELADAMPVIVKCMRVGALCTCSYQVCIYRLSTVMCMIC